jgi:hypothetical protein
MAEARPETWVKSGGVAEVLTELEILMGYLR